MKQNITQNELIAQWLNERWATKKVANIRIHLCDNHIPRPFRSDFYSHTARLFKHCYSRKFIKGARKNGNLAEMIVVLHREQGKHDPALKGRHFHILAEYPAENSIADVRSFVDDFCRKPRFDSSTRNYSLIASSSFHTEDALTVVGSGEYDLREGEDSLLTLP